MAYRLKHGQVPGFRLEVVTKAKTPALERHETSRTESDFHRLVHLVALAQSMIAAGHFEPSEQGFYCSGCPYQEACRNWHVDESGTHVRMAA